MSKKRKLHKVCLMLTAILLMQVPAAEADAASSASDFQMEGYILPVASADGIAVKIDDPQAPERTGATETSGLSERIGATETSGSSERTGAIVTSGSSESTGAFEASETDENVLGSSHVVGGKAFIFLDNTSPKMKNGNTSSNIDNAGKILPKYTIVDQQIVADQAYYGRKDMTSFLLPVQLQEIGELSFARSGLREILVPSGVKTIGFGAFYHCDSLQNVELPETIMCVEPEAFQHTAWVKGFLENGASDYLVSGGVLVAYRGSGEKITIPEGVRVIAAGVFAEHREIKSVTMPDSLKVIGEGAFENCGSLTEISGGLQVTHILDRAFAGCAAEQIEIMEAVKSIGLRAFDSAKIVVFQGSRLPALGYENSSGRLTKDAYRKGTFENVIIAIVDPGLTEQEIKDSVLFPQITGFYGIIGSIMDDGRFHCRFTSLTAQELEQLAVPSEFSMDGIRSYQVTGQDKISFLPEDRKTAEPGKVVVTGDVNGVEASLEGLSLDGIAQERDTQEVNTQEGNTQKGNNQKGNTQEGNTQKGNTQEGNTQEGISLKGNTQEGITRKGNGIEEGFLLDVKNADDSAGLEKAFQRSLHISMPKDMVVYDVTLTDGESALPITRLGSQKMTVTMTVPKQFQGRKIQLFTLDRNGQLEDVPIEVKQTGEDSTVTFLTGHFSLIGICEKSAVGW